MGHLQLLVVAQLWLNRDLGVILVGMGQRLQSNSCAIGALRTLSVCDEFDIYCLAIVSEIVVTTVTIEARLWCDLP